MLRLFNTLTRSKEEFIPINSAEVKMYSCGPTVYDYMHIGNLRTFFFEDTLLRVLKYNGYSVKYVMNITDVGHLAFDIGEGEDKMEKTAKELGKSVWDLSNYYSEVFKRDVGLMNIIPPNIYTKATDFIKEQIDLVNCLESKGFTYLTSDGVYFDTSKFPGYADFAKLNIEGLQEGARIEFSTEKRNITDFALWKFSPANEKRQMEWVSPWGIGFPGWHIECSAMSMAIFGNHFDIHCGGIDHIPIHHTNEIAQSEACSGEKFVNYWLHGEFLDMGNEKMSKSTGKFVTLQTLMDKGYKPMEYRYFLLMAHYKKKLKFTYEALDAAKNGYHNLSSKIIFLKSESSKVNNGQTSNPKLDNYKQKFLSVINDDLNMPEAMAILWEVIRDDELKPQGRLSLAYEFDKVFGLELDKIEAQTNNVDIPEEIISLSNQRTEAKKKRDFERADEIRELIKEKGFEIIDKRGEVEIRKL